MEEAVCGSFGLPDQEADEYTFSASGPSCLAKSSMPKPPPKPTKARGVMPISLACRVMSTASDLVFSGGREGYFYAVNARNGELLWKTAVGGPVASGPMSYSIGGKQYIAISAGNSLFVFGLRE